MHPDTLTRRFNRLVERAGVPRIWLHDVRHAYATMAMDAGVNPKLLSDRIGHANELVTLPNCRPRSADGGATQPLIEGAVEAASQAEQAS